MTECFRPFKFAFVTCILVVVALLVGLGFAVVVVGNDKTFGILGISLLRARHAAACRREFKVTGNMCKHVYSLQGLSYIYICSLIIDIYI